MATVMRRLIVGLLVCGALFAVLLHKTGKSPDVAHRNAPGSTATTATPEGPSEMELEQHAELARAIQQQSPAEMNLEGHATNTAIQANGLRVGEFAR